MIRPQSRPAVCLWLGFTVSCFGRAVAIVLAALLVWATAATAKPAGATWTPPRLLPGDAQATGANRAVSDTWLVGGTPDRSSHRIAAQFGGERLGKGSGTYRVARPRARPFVEALRAAGRYQFSEPNWLARSRASPLDPLSGSQWGLGAIGALPLTPPPVSASSPLLGTSKEASSNTPTPKG